jgi:peptidoglycan/xylan/chitin deacetylase (PgdA/CDA1 family)
MRRFLQSLLAAALLPSAAHAQQIAFTWDDLPAHSTLPPGETRVEIGRTLIAAMKAEHMPPVYGFVNGHQTEAEPLSAPMLQEWRDAGLMLGNHTWEHLNLNDSSLEEWEAGVLKNEPLLKSTMGDHDWHWLRYPNLAEGKTLEKRLAGRKFLAEHGYKIAGVTMSFRDYAYNNPYARCVAKNDTTAIAELESDYLQAADATIDYTRSVAQTLYGHDIPYVLLMHVGALDARLLPRLLKVYRDKGFTFVSLEEAEKDPFYKSDLDLSLSPVPNTLEEAMRAKNLPVPKHPEAAVNLETICR